MMKTPILLVSSALLVLALGCSDIVVRVGDKDKPRPEYQPEAIQKAESFDQTLAETWFADYSQLHEDQARALVSKLREGLRQQVRDGFAGIEQAVRSPVDLFVEVEDLAPPELRDDNDPLLITAEQQLGKWSTLLKGERYLTGEWQWSNSGSRKVLLDEVAVGLFFDFGINVRGESIFTEQDGAKQIASEIHWQLVPELGQEVTTSDRPSNSLPLSVRIRLIRLFSQTKIHQKLQDFQLEVLVGPGLFENNILENAAYYSLSLRFENNPADDSEIENRLQLWQGQRRGNSLSWNSQQSYMMSLRHSTEEAVQADSQEKERLESYELVIVKMSSEQQRSEKLVYRWLPGLGLQRQEL